jgi:sodium-independent sulfate anion transporter 11
LQFHFASILSPWIRRALVAGGFGVGTSSSRVPHEIAAVVPYRDGLADRQLTDVREGTNIHEEVDDIEKGNSTNSKEKVSATVDSVSLEFASPLSTDTPFFHLDLESAVRAAESGIENNDHRY